MSRHARIGLELPGMRKRKQDDLLLSVATRFLRAGWAPLFRETWDMRAKRAKVPIGNDVYAANRGYFDWYQQLRLAMRDGPLGPEWERQLVVWGQRYADLRAHVSASDAPAAENLVPQPTESWESFLARVPSVLGSFGIGFGVALAAVALILLMKGGGRA